jgi:hypothetical protein
LLLTKQATFWISIFLSACPQVPLSVPSFCPH